MYYVIDMVDIYVFGYGCVLYGCVFIVDFEY